MPSSLPYDPVSPLQHRSEWESVSMGGDLLSMPSGGQISLDEEWERERKRRDARRNWSRSVKGWSGNGVLWRTEGSQNSGRSQKMTWEHPGMCYEEGKQEANDHDHKRGKFMRERKVSTLFPHWPGRYSTLTLFWIRRVYQGCWSEGSRRRRAAVGSSGQDRESDKDKTRQGKTHYSPTAKETKTVPVRCSWRPHWLKGLIPHATEENADARTRVVRVIDRHSGSQELQNHSVEPASDSTDQHDRAVWTAPLHRSGLREDSR